MTVTVREPTDKDFFAWLDLYAGYGDFYSTPLTDDKAVLVWSWLTDAAHEENAFVAVADGGDLVGLAHYREFARPLAGGRGLFLDDLFVAPAQRGRGVGRSLISAVKERAESLGLNTVRWITGSDNQTAMKLYDTVADRTSWVMYGIPL